MKTIFILSLVFLIKLSNAQTSIIDKVDSSNYYSYYSSGKGLKGKKISTNWLKELEVVPIIIEELKAAGYNRIYDFELYKLTTGEYLILSVYESDLNVGIVYTQGHNADVIKEYRNKSLAKITKDVELSTYTYMQNDYDVTHISKLPSNIFTLSENSYWYQFTDNKEDDEKLITKDIVIKILRQDIKYIISKFPKLEKK
jgi:hypothetical protein